MPSSSVSSLRNWPPLSAAGRLRACLALVAVLLLLAACVDEPPPPLRLGTSPWLGTEPLFLARDLKLLKPSEVQLVELVDVPQVVSALLDGAIDGAALTLAEALRITERHAGFRIVLVADYCDGADVLIAQPDIPDLAALKGKRVGLEDAALSAHVLNRALQQAGLKLSDIHIRMLGPDEQTDTFERREIDALVAYDPTLSRVRALGGHVLFDTSQIPAEISDVVLVRSDRDQAWLALRSRQLLAAWFSAVDTLRADPAEAAARMAPRLRLAPIDIVAALAKTQFPDRALNAQHLTADPPGYVAVAERMKSTLIDTREATPTVAVESLFDRHFAQRLYR